MDCHSVSTPIAKPGPRALGQAGPRGRGSVANPAALGIKPATVGHQMPPADTWAGSVPCSTRSKGNASGRGEVAQAEFLAAEGLAQGQ